MREHLGHDAEVLERDSAQLGSTRAAAGLLRGGLAPDEVADAVRRTGAGIVHAHNLHPALGWRALAAARGAGARVVLHLHNYRLVCAVGTCVDSAGHDCVRCHGRDTRPGVRLDCRQGGRAEAAVYAAALAAWSARMVAQADAVVAPSAAALTRLRTLGAPLPAHVTILGHPVRIPDGEPSPPPPGGPALVTTRLAAEKDVGTALTACARAGVGLVVAGDGPRRGVLEAQAHALGLRLLASSAAQAPPNAHGPRSVRGAWALDVRPGAGEVMFAGRLSAEALAEARAAASVVLVPTRAQETFGLAALEAMAAGRPVVAARAGALGELGPDDGVTLVDPGDPEAMAAALTAARGDAAAGARAHAAARRRAAPEVVAARLAEVYASVRR